MVYVTFVIVQISLSPLDVVTQFFGSAGKFSQHDRSGAIRMLSVRLLKCSIELSSIGIRVDSKVLTQQLTAAGCEERRELAFHAGVLDGKYPQTIGGGIGQSRLCMFLLQKKTYCRVQICIWPGGTLSDN